MEEISPEDVVNVAKLVDERTRVGGAASIGLGLAKQHVDEEYPGAVDKQIKNVHGATKKGLKRTTGFVRGLTDWE